MKTRGITLIELMIAMALLVIAIAGVSIVYTTGQRMVEGGLREIDVQKDIQVIGERITRWIRPASGFTILEDGDRIDIVTLITIYPLTEVTSSIYYYDEKIYYDANILDGYPAVEVVEGVYKIPGEAVFSSPASNLVYTRFGISSDYTRILVEPMEVALGIRIRNVD